MVRVGVVIRIPMMLNDKRDEEDKVYDVGNNNNNVC
jgi:hypothetical protein